MMRLRSDSVDSEEKVMSRNGTCYVGRKGCNGCDGFGGGGVFEDDSEFGESGSEGFEMGEKVFLRVEDGDVLNVSGSSISDVSGSVKKPPTMLVQQVRRYRE